MTARLTCVLRCDHVGCDARFAWADPSVTYKPPRVGEAREVAASEGWRWGIRARDDNRSPVPTVDFCPKHADDVLDPAHADDVLDPAVKLVPQPMSRAHATVPGEGGGRAS